MHINKYHYYAKANENRNYYFGSGYNIYYQHQQYNYYYRPQEYQDSNVKDYYTRYHNDYYSDSNFSLHQHDGNSIPQIVACNRHHRNAHYDKNQTYPRSSSSTVTHECDTRNDSESETREADITMDDIRDQLEKELEHEEAFFDALWS
ncbi:hypothetical protein BDB00DRAFT_791122 [Zychaea mexicana]|uniref:uncharacterized protein n=1 Tax=Zychaea mexicana TaxID=64656 RepID=UPI0022FE4E0F|nr:uncharacterized protein BDB00DRAFT_791122 [Zychaea mexicana]KAI9489419.1 hypothetical protein BDB00DRAFT_791122 [Zychaea mexicana]